MPCQSKSTLGRSKRLTKVRYPVASVEQMHDKATAEEAGAIAKARDQSNLSHPFPSVCSHPRKGSCQFERHPDRYYEGASAARCGFLNKQILMAGFP